MPLNPIHLNNIHIPELPDIIGVRQHHYAIQPVFTPILFFLIIEDIGQEADSKMCPCCPKMGENLTRWHSTKKQFQRLYF